MLKKVWKSFMKNGIKMTLDLIYERSLWQVARSGRSSRKQMRQFYNKHQGQRCFIIGNGPSLKKMDLSPLRHEYTFGLNRIYLLFPELGFTTTYHVCVNRLVIEQFGSDMQNLATTKFINWTGRKWVSAAPDLMFIHTVPHSKFFTDISKRVGEGATVTYVAMQIAYYMGFEQVILIGVDHSFATKGKPHTTVVSLGDDPNHFDPRYFGKGVRWQLPDLEASELAYRIAKERFEEAGREIVDATIDGKLQVFRKVDYHTLFTPTGKSNTP